MKIEGENAVLYQVVRSDSLAAVPGVLVSADEDTGQVIMLDRTGEKKVYELGPRSIRILPKHRYG